MSGQIVSFCSFEKYVFLLFGGGFCFPGEWLSSVEVWDCGCLKRSSQYYLVHKGLKMLWFILQDGLTLQEIIFNSFQQIIYLSYITSCQEQGLLGTSQTIEVEKKEIKLDRIQGLKYVLFRVSIFEVYFRFYILH